MKTIIELQKQVDDFNAKYKIGNTVKISGANDIVKYVTVKHEATILGGHSAVGWFEEISGCYSLDKVKEDDIIVAGLNASQ